MARKSSRKQDHSPDNTHHGAKSGSDATAVIADNRPSAVAQLKQQQTLDNSAAKHTGQVPQQANQQSSIQNAEHSPDLIADLSPGVERGIAQLATDEGIGLVAGSESVHEQESLNSGASTMQHKETTVQRQEKVTQRLSVFKKLKEFLSVKSVALALEGIGHIAAGVIAVAAGGATAASLVGVAPGTIAIVGGVGQILIGVSKWVRAAIVGWAKAHNENGKPTEKAKAWIDGLTAFEAAIGISSTVVTAGASALVGAIIGGIASLVKLIRAAMSGILNKKLPDWVVMLEGLGGAFGSLASMVGKGASGAVDVIKFIVNSIKSFRGAAAADEAAAMEEKEGDGKQGDS